MKSKIKILAIILAFVILIISLAGCNVEFVEGEEYIEEKVILPTLEEPKNTLDEDDSIEHETNNEVNIDDAFQLDGDLGMGENYYEDQVQIPNDESVLENEEDNLSDDTHNDEEIKKEQYDKEIEAENEKHKQKIEEINAKYDSQIKGNEEEARYWRSMGGYGSSSSYNSQIISLQSEIEQKERKLAMMMADTSGAYQSQIRRLESELSMDYVELQELMTNQMYAEMAESFESQASTLKAEKQRAVSYEKNRHESAIEEINRRYGY